MKHHAPGTANPEALESRFLWGVATSAYQSEGGFNGPAQPQTNWADAESREDVVPLGQAADFWNRYPEDFANCRSMGLSAFRLGVEWSRVQPTSVNRVSAPPPFDFAALEHYVDMLSACRDNGLEPVLTLHHFVHPAWLGPDPWLDPATVDHFSNYVRTIVLHINRALVSKRHPPVRYYITVNEPNMLVLNTYLGKQFPSSARGGIHNGILACNQLLRAHIVAYNLIHDLYAAEGWLTPMVSLNNYCSDLYWLDKLLLDLLSMRERQIAPEDGNSYILSKRLEFEKAFAHAQIPLRKDLSYYCGALFKRISNRLGRHYFKAEKFRPLMTALYRSPRERVFDYLAVDYYDPFSAHTFRSPNWWDHEFKNKSFHSWAMNSVTSKWWDWRVLPRGMHWFCQYYSVDYHQRPVLIAENGMALRRRIDNTASHRRDRLSRSEFLSLHIEEVIRIVRDGIPLIGYLHWSLFDNYEWGTYTPRFGIFRLDYQQGTERIPIDHHGDCPSATYSSLIKQARFELSLIHQLDDPGISSNCHIEPIS